MKTNNIFDYMDKDYEEISEDSVMEQTGVKTDNVRRIFMKKLHEQDSVKTTGKKIKKRTIIVLAAAAVSLLALGTIGAGAAGSFNAVFGERFAGEKVNGVYSGADIDVSVADGYESEFLGITGDHHNVMAAANIKKTDGGSFVKSEDLKDSYATPMLYGPITEEDYNQVVASLGVSDEDLNYNGKLDVTTSLWNQVTNNNGTEEPGRGGLEYVLTDEHTIKCIMQYENQKYELVGEKMLAEAPLVYIYHVKSEIVETSFSDGVDVGYLMEYGEDQNGTSGSEEVKKAVAKIEEVKKTLGENEFVIKKDNLDLSSPTTSFYVAEISAERIDFSGSWKLNYKAENIRKLQVQDNLFTLDGSYQGHDFSEVSIKVSEIDADAFTAKMKLSITGDILVFKDVQPYSVVNMWEDAFRDEFYNGTVIITLENGDTVDGWFTITDIQLDDDGGTSEAVIVYAKNKNVVTISANEIRSIQMNGTELIK